MEAKAKNPMSRKESMQNMQAAADVNDDDALNTIIQGSEIPIIQADLDDSQQSNSLLTDNSPGISSKNSMVSPAVTNVGGRELIWKTADGAEKRLLLPIEMIQEDIMDDPEHLLNTLNPEVKDEDRAKILSALQEMQGNIRQRGDDDTSQTNQVHTLKGKTDESAMELDKSVYIADTSMRGTVNETAKRPEKLNTTFSDGISKDLESNNASELASPSLPTSLASKTNPSALQKAQNYRGQKTFKKPGKGKKVRKEPRRNQSELLKSEIVEDIEEIEEVKEERDSVDGASEESKPIDTATYFAEVKRKFYEQDTQLNSEMQLEEIKALAKEQLKKEEAELARQQKEEEEQKRREDELQREEQVYGPGGRFGQRPELAAITRVLEEQERARRLKRKKEKEERLAQLKAEKEARGEQLNEDDMKIVEDSEPEEIDYKVVMQEEELVPEGEAPIVEKEQNFEGVAKRQIVRGQAKLVKLKADANLPKKLPDNLVFWNRLETRVESQKLVSYSMIQNFQKAEMVQFLDEEANKKVMKQFPIIDELESWQDTDDQKYVNIHEKSIYEMRAWPKSQKDYPTEGYIKFERLRPFDCLFNSRFESGNLRQVFKVPQEVDFDWIPLDETVPDYLPEELQTIQREEIKQKRIAYVKQCNEKYIEEEKEDQKEMELPPAQRTKQYGPLYYVEKKDEYAPVEEPKNEEEKNPDLEAVKSDNEEAAEKQKKKDKGGSDSSEKEDGDDKSPKKKGKKKKGRGNDNFGKPSCEYNLYLQDDTNADSALFQWYYFNVMNIKTDTVIRINICNLSKPNGLYAKGMKPFVYSTNKFKQTGQGWHRAGENVHYFENGRTTRFSKKTLDAHWISDGSVPVGKDQYKQCHQLSFDYKFESDYDIVFFAHFQPYTYKDQVNFLCQLQADESNKDKMRMDHVCNALGGAPMYGLTITSNIKTQYVPQGKEIFKFQRFEYKNAVVKPKKIKYIEDAQDDDIMSSQSVSSKSDQSIRVDDEQLANERRSMKVEPPAPLESTTDIQVAAIQIENPTKEGGQAPTVQQTSVISVKPFDDEEENGNVNRTVQSLKEKSIDSTIGELTTPKKKKGAQRRQSSQGAISKLHDTDRSGKKGGFAAVVQQDPNEGKEEKFYKKYIFITSRVHPGESQASHMVHGVIQFLLSDEPEAQEIREKFIVKVIPMLNPDGVIHGNYRVSLLGVDLNRRWKKPSKFLHPTVYYTKQLIKYFNEKSRQQGCDSGGVVMCCDMHGHSRNMDLFMYSCLDSVSANNLVIRSIPVGVDRHIPIFNIKNCNFALEKDKENTARVVLFKEFGILASFTLEATFYGSEQFKKQKQGAFLMTKEQQDYQAERYSVSYARKDISLDDKSCILVGADFMRGINYQSKKKPLLLYWFRQPPKNIIELFKPGGNMRDDGIDPALLELEKAWKPLGHVRQDKHLGVGDRFDEAGVVIPRTPPDEKLKGRKVDTMDIALIDKQKRQKREAAAKRKKNKLETKNQLDKMVEREASTQQKDLNSDMMDIMGDGSMAKKKKKKRRAQSPNKRLGSPARRVNSPNRRQGSVSKKNRPVKMQNSADNVRPSQFLTDSREREKENSIDIPGTPGTSGKKVPILLREPGAVPDDSDSQEYDDPMNVSQQVMSKNKGIKLGQKQKYRTSDPGIGPVRKTPHQSSSEEENEDNHYLMSKALDSVSKSQNKQHIFNSLMQSDQNFSKGNLSDERVSENGSPNSKRQLNLSVRMKEGKAAFKNVMDPDIGPDQLPRIESLMEDATTTEDRVQSRMISQKFSDLNIQQRATGGFKQTSREVLAMEQLNEVADESMLHEQKIIDNLEQTKKQHLTQQVSAEELDDLMRTDTLDMGQMAKMTAIRNAAFAEATFSSPKIGANNTFRKNKLSCDPLVLPTTKLANVSQVHMKTLEKEMTVQYQSIRSPRKSIGKSAKSPGKFVFAPTNGVYNQTQLIQNPELAQQKGINFMVNQNDPIFSMQNHQMGLIKQQLGMKNIGKLNGAYSHHHHNLSKNPSLSNQIGFGSQKDTSGLMSQGMTKKGSRIFQSKMSTAGLLQKSMSNQSSLTTIQTVIGSGGVIDQGFSINDFVQEQMSLLEKTRVKVAAKPKKRKHKVVNLTQAKNLQTEQDDHVVDHSATLILPNIAAALQASESKVNQFGHKYNLSSSSIKQGSMGDLNSLGANLNSEGNTTTGRNVQATDSMSMLDGQSVELPSLSPRTIRAKRTVDNSPRKYLEVKNGFDFANNVQNRHHEKLFELKQNQTLRAEQRRKNKPQFIIKPLDQREFLKIQMQYVESDEVRDSSPIKFQQRQGLSQRPRHNKQRLESIDAQIQTPQPQQYATSRNNPGISPVRSRRTMSMGQPNSINAQSYNSPGPHVHPAMALLNQSPEPYIAAKASLRKEIRQREVKSQAVQNLVNQTMVVNNKLLVFKPN